jgi:site-specific DNA recombinase
VPVGVYLRVSTEEQRERHSIETQRELAERYCGFQKLVVSQVYADDGISGTIPLDRRPEGSRILHDARLKKFDQLLIFKLDRLGRDARLILNYVAELESLGVRVKSLTEEFDTGTAGGRLMLTMLSGFAAHEREQIRERSIAGTNRIAETGAWLGGIVPFGYRKEGEKRNAKLLVAEEPMEGFFMSEAEVIRMIFQMITVEGKSCYAVSDHLNRLGVPCAYKRDGRMHLLAKRKQNTSGLWRPSRVRNIVVNTMYMGRHEYGKRSANPNRKLITRAVPAIVGEQTWNKAQAVLKANWLFGVRSAKKQYLLRGLVKCELCNLTYIGLCSKRPSGRTDFYYRCNGKHGTRGIYGEKGLRCPSKAINGDYLEKTI